MPQGQAGGPRAQEARQGPRRGEGLLGPQEVELQAREGAGRPFARLRVPRPEGQEAHVPLALDRADQRGGACERALVQPVHGRRAPGRASSSTASRSPTSRSRTRRRSPWSRSARRPRSSPNRRQPENLIESRQNEKLRLVRKLLSARKHREESGLFAVESEDLVEAARDASIEPVELLVAGENVVPELLGRGVDARARAARGRASFGGPTCRSGTRDVTLALWRVTDPGKRRDTAADGRCVRRGGLALARVRRSARPAGGPRVGRRDLPRAARRVGRRAGSVRRASSRTAASRSPRSISSLRSRSFSGSEREGLPEALVTQCHKATIPLPGEAESLNVAAAGAIALYELSRRGQRLAEPARRRLRRRHRRLPRSRRRLRPSPSSAVPARCRSRRRGRRSRGCDAGAEVAARRDPVDRARLVQRLGHVDLRALEDAVGDPEGDPVHEEALPEGERRGRRLLRAAGSRSGSGGTRPSARPRPALGG